MYVDFLHTITLLCRVKKDILKRFGERIRELRTAKGWSQEALADKTEFHRTYIGMVERGERNLSLKNIEVFANAFGIALKTLLNF